MEVASTKLSEPKATKSSVDKVSISQKKVLKRGKFWSNLLWVRPWLLVVVLWLTFVLMIAIALAGLSNPGREMALEPVKSSIVGQPLSAPDAAAVSRLIPRDQVVLAQRDPAATLPGAVEQSMPAWPLLVMVAACAGGCMLMSSQGTLTPESRRGRRRGVTTAQTGPRPVGPRSVKLRPVRNGSGKRRAKYRRNAQRSTTTPVVAIRPPGQKQRPAPQQSVPSRSQPVASANGGMASAVTVVPDNETSPLDWKEGSLAHKLDVRQTRSINSFL
ncbi:hypothetical protein N836_15350 [Leptolyngbya sp. Heron Island J]|nr:hypothetical protein N836_15350 [Leptolyngbya sp. Heron Island J]